MSDELIERLTRCATGGHPDHGTPDRIFRDALDRIIILQHKLEVSEACNRAKSEKLIALGVTNI